MGLDDDLKLFTGSRGGRRIEARNEACAPAMVMAPTSGTDLNTAPADDFTVSCSIIRYCQNANITSHKVATATLDASLQA